MFLFINKDIRMKNCTCHVSSIPNRMRNTRSVPGCILCRNTGSGLIRPEQPRPLLRTSRHP